MKELREECKSADLLIQSTEKLVASLNAEYKPQPEDPRSEFSNAALSVVFFCKCVLRELIGLRKYDLKGTGGLRLAIALADMETARTLLAEEINEIASEDPAYLPIFVDELRATMVEMQLGEDWWKMLPT